MLLYGAGEVGPDSKKRGFSREEVQPVFDGVGALPVTTLIRCRVRYFTYGLALGSCRFVDSLT